VVAVVFFRDNLNNPLKWKCEVALKTLGMSVKW